MRLARSLTMLEPDGATTFRVAMCSPKLCTTFTEGMLQGIGIASKETGS